ncbi:hypothetical protein OSTOST_24207, partial [Ostertagia ostertagi]
MISETPVFPVKIQDGNRRKRRLDLCSPTSPDFVEAANELTKDESIPLYVRTVLAFLLESRREIDSMSRQIKELKDENTVLRKSLDSFKLSSSSNIASSQNPAPSNSSGDGVNQSFEEIERKRSVIIVGVPENRGPRSYDRVSHDRLCVHQLFDFLAIDCTPVSIYRMGRPSPTYNRLLKVVLPNSFFARLLLRCAPKLKHFPLKKGVFIRPSLSKGERERIRAEREAEHSKRTGSKDVNVNSRNVISPNNDHLMSSRVMSSNIGFMNSENFAVIALTETWLSDVISNESIFGEYCNQYEILRCDRRDRRGGGVAIIAKKMLSPRIIFSESVGESYELLCVDFDMADSRTRVVLVYKAPSCTSAMFDQLLKAIGDLVESSSFFLLLGDFNLPEIMWLEGCSPSAHGSRASRFLEMCRSLNLSQLVKGGTHGPNILDLLLTNNLEFVRNAQILAPVGGSDHASIFFELNIEVDIRTNTILRRDFRSANFESILNYLYSVDWYGSFNSVDTVNEKYELFLAILHHTIELFVPLKPCKATDVQLPQHIVRWNRKKNLAWYKAVASGSPKDWDDYRNLRVAFEKRFVNLRLKKSKGLSVLFANDGTAIIKDKDKAELLANVFDSAYQKVDDSSEF